MKPVIGQSVHYDYGYSHYTGEVVELYDDCYIVKGPHIGKVRVSYDHLFTKSITPSIMNLLFKDGNPVIKKKRFWLF